MQPNKLTTILIPVPQADKIINKWRKEYDDNSPAHITLLYPFKDSKDINDEIITKLKFIFSNVKSFSYTLIKINTFSNAIFLEPTHKDRFIELTQKIASVFPENPPYEGKYHSIIPHLTLGQFNESQDQKNIEMVIKNDIQSKLPIHAIANEAWLMEINTNTWSRLTKFPFS